jgi:hypothetical protein
LVIPLFMLPTSQNQDPIKILLSYWPSTFQHWTTITFDTNSSQFNQIVEGKTTKGNSLLSLLNRTQTNTLAPCLGLIPRLRPRLHGLARGGNLQLRSHINCVTNFQIPKMLSLTRRKCWHWCYRKVILNLLTFHILNGEPP